MLYLLDWENAHCDEIMPHADCPHRPGDRHDAEAKRAGERRNAAISFGRARCVRRRATPSP
ncbi:hypothetical protein [Ralstonia pseudosolanacearum]|uniref:hypothetical protein n=1 Tax=Ralstonia pseudosolanacearum TaxID=1310165 RepID=UPI00397C710A